jgi:shikimate kinase
LDNERRSRPIVLIGFPGSGKTTVGAQLAKSLGGRFLDLDDVIVASARQSIPEIFRAEGEPGFRQRERAALTHVLSEAHAVIATGGGAACQEDNLQLMLDQADVVALWASPEETVRRTGTRSGRPLMDGVTDPLAHARAMFAARAPFYRRAHVSVDTEGKRPEAIVAEIVAAIAALAGKREPS